MRLLKKVEIIYFNKETIKAHGGAFYDPANLLHPESLEYLVETVDAKMFGQELYPIIAEKAAFYLFQIISNHVFQDGNKRTGLQSALSFLHINGYELREILIRLPTTEEEKDDEGLRSFESSDIILEDFVIDTASGKLSLKDCSIWFELNVIELEPLSDQPY